MKKLLTIIVLSSTLLLAGCGGDKNVTPAKGAIEGTSYVTDDFSLDIPLDWEVIDEFEAGYPDNAIVSIRNHVKDNSFVANVNVTYSYIDGGLDANSFATQMLNTHKDTLTNFQTISKENMTIDVKGAPATTVLNIFEGKQTPESETLRFMQTYGYSGNTAYVVTGVHNLREELFAKEKVENTVRSFSIR